MYGRFGNDVGVESVTEINRIDIITKFQTLVLILVIEIKRAICRNSTEVEVGKGGSRLALQICREDKPTILNHYT
jgi:hypothetical protein